VLVKKTYSPSGEVLFGWRLNRYGYEGKEQELGFGKIPTDDSALYGNKKLINEIKRIILN
jgi:hypothetical protein